MNILTSTLKQNLKEYLALNKPGFEGQKLMMPESRNLFKTNHPTPTPSAVIIALFIENQQLHFPIIRRPIYNGIHSGQMALPGGKFDEIDNDLTQTALRECNEEIGIPESNIDVIGHLTELYIPITNMQVTPVLAFLNQKPIFKTNCNEVDELFVISANEILAPENKKSELWNVHGKDRNIPFYHIQNQKIWGATAMILSEFEQILRKVQ